MKKLIAIVVLVIAVVCISCNTHERCPIYTQAVDTVSETATL